MSSKRDVACYAAAAVLGLVLIARAKRVESVVEAPVIAAVAPKACGKKVKAAVRLTLKDDQLAYLQSIVSVSASSCAKLNLVHIRFACLAAARWLHQGRFSCATHPSSFCIVVAS